ncbi:serine hydrolase domain-containing protein [Peribacillus sp. SCS-26]|uniref:serine hydrolase domain-containing protein n=1 Tax=Paraperibacillus marinus TaxID=3115295 RepID=UPI003905A287
MNLEKLVHELKKEKINAVLISQNNEMIFHYYKNNKQKNKLHKLNSCTKSILSLLIGIALEKGVLQSLDEPVGSYFPKLFFDLEDKRKLELTLRDLITMTEGLDFPEFGEWNCFSPMVYHHDIVKFTLTRPLIHESGTHMNYNSGCSHILSAILSQAAAMKTEEFAAKHLFHPLGIHEYRWYTDNKGINKGADGLVLKISDMHKIGLLMLDEGKFNGTEVVPLQWIRESTAPNLLTYEYIGHYGMHWWVDKLDKTKNFSPPNTYYFALGYGGQFMIVIPGASMVITIASDIYTDSMKPMTIIKDLLLLK